MVITKDVCVCVCVCACACVYALGSGYRTGTRTIRKKEKKENVVKLLPVLIVLIDSSNLK